MQGFHNPSMRDCINIALGVNLEQDLCHRGKIQNLPHHNCNRRSISFLQPFSKLLPGSSIQHRHGGYHRFLRARCAGWSGHRGMVWAVIAPHPSPHPQSDQPDQQQDIDHQQYPAHLEEQPEPFFALLFPNGILQDRLHPGIINHVGYGIAVRAFFWGCHPVSVVMFDTAHLVDLEPLVAVVTLNINIPADLLDKSPLAEGPVGGILRLQKPVPAINALLRIQGIPGVANRTYLDFGIQRSTAVHANACNVRVFTGTIRAGFHIFNKLRTITFL